MREQVGETHLLVENRGWRWKDGESGGIAVEVVTFYKLGGSIFVILLFSSCVSNYCHLLINEPEPKSSQTKIYSNITEKQCPLERTKRKVTCFIQHLLKWLLL